MSLLAVLIATASAPSLSVVRDAHTDACADEAAMVQAITHRLGHVAYVDDAALFFRVVFSHDNFPRNRASFSARIERLDAASQVVGVRHLASDNCDTLSEAVALTISMAITSAEQEQRVAEPDSASSAVPNSTPQPTPSRGAPRQVDRRAQSASQQTTRAERTPLENPHWQLSAGGGAAAGLVPRVAPAADLSTIVRFTAWSLAAEGHGLIPTEASMGGGTVRSWLVAGALAPCFHYRWLGACGVFYAGAVSSEGRALDAARTAATPWLALAPRLALQIPLARVLSLRGRAELVVPLIQTAVRVSGVTTWSSPSVGGWFGLDVVVQIR